MLEIRGVSKKFHNQQAMATIDFKAQSGTVTLIMGPNGSGKTTLLKCIAGLLDYEAGQISYNNQNYTYRDSSCREWIGFSPNKDQSFFPQLTLYQNIIFFRNLFCNENNRMNEGQIHELFQLFEMEIWKNTPYQTCSSGIKKRTSILRALTHSPKILLLDEPFSHIDQQFIPKMENLLQEITHDHQLITVIATNQETSIKGKQIILRGDKND